MNPLAERIKELEKDIDYLNPDSGVHKGHWTFDDIQQATLNGIKEGARLALEEIRHGIILNCRNTMSGSEYIPWVNRDDLFKLIKSLMAELEQADTEGVKG